MYIGKWVDWVFSVCEVEELAAQAVRITELREKGISSAIPKGEGAR